jgi:hypothetical protein
MKELTHYYKNGYDFALVARTGDLAIARGISRHTGRVNWEIIEIQSHNGIQMGDNWVEACFYPPSNNQWGDKGWTALNEKHAYEIYNRKCQDIPK